MCKFKRGGFICQPMQMKFRHRKCLKDSNKWEPYDSYAQLMWAIGRPKESIAAAEKAVEVDPEAHFARCVCDSGGYLSQSEDDDGISE